MRRPSQPETAPFRPLRIWPGLAALSSLILSSLVACAPPLTSISTTPQASSSHPTTSESTQAPSIRRSSSGLHPPLRAEPAVEPNPDDSSPEALPSPNRTVHYYNGNPLELVRGTTRNTESPFVVSNLDSFSGFDLVRIERFYQFEERSAEDDTSLRRAMEQQSPADEPAEQVQAPYRFSQTDEKYRLEPAFENFDPEEDPRLEFALRDGRLVLEKEVVGEGEQIEERFALPLHYSVHSDGQSFSLLYQTALQDSTSGSALVAAYFIRHQPEPVVRPEADRRFRYVTGPGVRVRWEQGHTLKLCGFQTSRHLPFAQYGLRQWQSSLPTSRQQADLEIDLSPPPFSDLNHQCIWMIEDLESEDSSGVTVQLEDLSRMKWIDSDIFVFVRTNTEASESTLPTSAEGSTINDATDLVRVMVHEIGHWFGLDHQFDESILSSMGYGQNQTVNPSRYDRAAMEALHADE